jgi:hypothetical protein
MKTDKAILVRQIKELLGTKKPFRQLWRLTWEELRVLRNALEDRAITGADED